MVIFYIYSNDIRQHQEALESVMCDVIRIATRSGKGNQPLNIKTDVEWPILKLGLQKFWWRFYFSLLLVASLLFRRIFMTSHMTLSSASNIQIFFLSKMTTSTEAQLKKISKITQNSTPSQRYWVFSLL